MLKRLDMGRVCIRVWAELSTKFSVNRVKAHLPRPLTSRTGPKIENRLRGCFDAVKRTGVFRLDQPERDIAAVDDEGRAQCILGQILGALKEGNRFNRWRLLRSLDHGCVRAALALFIDTDGAEWRSKRQTAWHITVGTGHDLRYSIHITRLDRFWSLNTYIFTWPLWLLVIIMVPNNIAVLILHL